MKKAGTVPFCKRRGSARNLTNQTQFREQVTRSEGCADVFGRERLSCDSKHVCPFPYATCGEGDVTRNHDVIRLHVFDDPVVSSVQSLINNLQDHSRFIGETHARSGDEGDPEIVSPRDLVDLMFNRTSIGIYINVQHNVGYCITREVYGNAGLSGGDNLLGKKRCLQRSRAHRSAGDERV